jgi:hypothetical protein
MEMLQTDGVAVGAPTSSVLAEAYANKYTQY